MKIERGVCRYCKCTDDRACVLGAALFDQHPPQTCSWADPLRTVCTNPRCLRRWKEDTQRKIKARKRSRARVIARSRKRRRHA